MFSSDGQTAFVHQFFDITGARGIAQIPTHDAEDDVSFNVASFDQGDLSRPVSSDRRSISSGLL
jgi:hypothetical protein